MVTMNELSQKLSIPQNRVGDRGVISVARRGAWQIGEVETHSFTGYSING